MVVCVYPLLGKAPDPGLAFRKPTCPRCCHCIAILSVRLAACSPLNRSGVLPSAIPRSTTPLLGPPPAIHRRTRPVAIPPPLAAAASIHPAPSSSGPRPPSLALDSCAVLTLPPCGPPPPPTPAGGDGVLAQSVHHRASGFQLPAYTSQLPVSILQSRAGDSSRFCKETPLGSLPLALHSFVGTWSPASLARASPRIASALNLAAPLHPLAAQAAGPERERERSFSRPSGKRHRLPDPRPTASRDSSSPNVLALSCHPTTPAHHLPQPQQP